MGTCVLGAWVCVFDTNCCHVFCLLVAASFIASERCARNGLPFWGEQRPRSLSICCNLSAHAFGSTGWESGQEKEGKGVHCVAFSTLHSALRPGMAAHQWFTAENGRVSVGCAWVGFRRQGISIGCKALTCPAHMCYCTCWQSIHGQLQSVPAFLACTVEIVVLCEAPRRD